MLSYAITDRHLYLGSEADKRRALCDQALRLAGQGIAFLQICEKDLAAHDLLDLTQAIDRAIADQPGDLQLLLNASVQVARAAPVRGIHLPSAALAELKDAIPAASLQPEPPRPWLISTACHTLEQVDHAKHLADLILFAPVFAKPLPDGSHLPGTGLTALAEACRRAFPTPVLALGGITPANTASCVEAGASGMAGIRMFL